METTETYKLVKSLENMIAKNYPAFKMYEKYIDYYAIANFMLMEIKHAEHRYSQVKSE